MPPVVALGNGARRLGVPLFFLAWTCFAAGIAWWLIQSARDHVQPQLLFDSSQSPIPVSEQIRRWLTIADLNFRGAYPWVLLAPYVIWLASRFVLERGRLRFSLPIHIAGCALFAAASQMLATHVVEKMHMVMVLTDRRDQKLPTEEMVTNVSGTILSNTSDKPLVETGPHNSKMAEVRTEIVISGGKVKAFESNSQTNVTDGPLNLSLMTNWNANARSVLTQGTVVERFLQSPDGSRFSSLRSSWRYESHLFSNLLNVLAYAGLAGLAHAVHFYRRSRERERRAAFLESNLAKARLHTLQAQLQPHFLFNALNAVATLLRSDARAAQEALTSFSELLRLALSQSDRQEVSLVDDLQFVQRYVEIQQTRLGDRFRFEQDVDPAALDCLVPALLLQPLVENALRHGIEPLSTPGRVRIIVKRLSDRLRLTVEDNGLGLRQDEETLKTGIGLSNLRQRLEALYGSNQKIELFSRPEGGVVVEMEIPLREMPVSSAP